MIELLQMWALVEVLGIICLPLTFTVFHNLPDRGWAFNKAIGIALLAFCVWLPLMYVQSLPFSQLFIFGILLILVALNLIGFLRVWRKILQFVRSNISYIVVCELVFLGMAFLLGWIRSYGPDIRINEMFMDEGFLSAIMRSTHFPPNDMWLSGYPINYYYYAHYTIAVLAKLLGQPSYVAFNTGISTLFGLTAVNLLGITCNIVAWARYRHQRARAAEVVAPDAGVEQSERPDIVYPPLLGAVPYGLLTLVMGLILGNLASTQQWWIQHGDLPPYYWYDPSRVIDKTINEFPAFSFLLSCFHAHVLTLAFTIVGIALGLNLFLEHNGKGLLAFGRGWRLPFTLGMTAVIIGGLFTMNGWDYPTYLCLALICIALQQWLAYQAQFSFSLVLDVITAAIALGALSFFLYAPFYINFISPSEGIGIVGPSDRTPIGDEVLIYGIFAFIFISLLLITLFRKQGSEDVGVLNPAGGPGSPQPATAGNSRIDYRQVSQRNGNQNGHPSNGSYQASPLRQHASARQATNVEAGQLIGQYENTPAASEKDEPDNVEAAPPGEDEAPLADTQSDDDPTSEDTPVRRGWPDMRLIIVLLILVVGLLTLVVMKNSLTFVVTGSIAALGTMLVLTNLHDRPRAFTLLLGTTAFALVAFCEVFFLKDVFADTYPRMNTVFKFYFQSWALLSVTCGAGLYFIMEHFRPAANANSEQRFTRRTAQVIWLAALFLFLVAGSIYPVVGSYQRTNQFASRTNSLDGLAYMKVSDPADYYGILWLNANIQGDPVIVEAVGPDYSDYARISAFTGLPTIMGWIGHEYQWRFNWLNKDNNAADFNRRQSDVTSIYTDKSPSVVLSLMARYSAQYLYVGPLEEETYLGANLHRFSAFMQVVYSSHGVTIYKVK
jgi:uncharacterized membrane protein